MPTFNTPPSVQPFRCLEGFARITRENTCDIFIVQNHELPGETFASLAFALDDFDATSKSYGEPWVLMDGDKIEYLGTQAHYFNNVEASALLNVFPNNCGLLPIVRAMESIKAKGMACTEADVAAIVHAARADYDRRRAEQSML